jgi:hypothetical protein
MKSDNAWFAVSYVVAVGIALAGAVTRHPGLYWWLLWAMALAVWAIVTEARAEAVRSLS